LEAEGQNLTTADGQEPDDVKFSDEDEVDEAQAVLESAMKNNCQQQ